MSSTAKSDESKLIPLDSLGSYHTFAPRSAPKELPAFEAPIPEAFAKKYREWKLKQRKEKHRKRKRAEEGEISDSHFVRDPRNDSDFDPSNLLGLWD